jgi:hypothetical protein
MLMPFKNGAMYYWEVSLVETFGSYLVSVLRQCLLTDLKSEFSIVTMAIICAV